MHLVGTFTIRLLPAEESRYEVNDHLLVAFDILVRKLFFVMSFLINEKGGKKVLGQR